MRLLIVGDYHAEPKDLDDCQALADFVCEKAKQYKCPVLFLGDQYHTHAIIHAEVQLFWYRLYKRLGGIQGSISLVGNHDRPGTSSSEASAMLAHDSDTQVVDSPVASKGGVLFLPYYHEPDEFVAACNAHPECHTVFCHQTFDGSKYENGFFASDGVDPNLIPQKNVISGHIHAPQSFGKVWYVGAPRWRTLSDANTTRNIWLVDIDSNGKVDKESFDTGNVCRRIIHFSDREEDQKALPPDGDCFDLEDDIHVDIYGSVEYIESRASHYRGLGMKVRTFRQVVKQNAVTESDGVEKALGKWIDGYKPSRGTPAEKLREMLKERTGIVI